MQPLDFQLRPSLILQRVVILSWLTLVVICVTADLPWWQTITFILLSLWRLVICLRHYALLQTANSLRQIHISINGWRVKLANGSTYDAQLLSGCRFLPGLIILRLQLTSKDLDKDNNNTQHKLWWVLLADSANSEALRRLRVWGRWGPAVIPNDSY